MLCDFGEVVLSVDTTNRIQFVDAEEFFAVHIKLITINRKRDFVFAAASDLAFHGGNAFRHTGYKRLTPHGCRCAVAGYVVLDVAIS